MSSDMNEVTITGLEHGAFRVEVGQGPGATVHRVEVPLGWAGGMGLGHIEEEEIVRESMAFLLEREPASSILPEFGLDIIGRYFPEYSKALPKRLNR